MKPVLPRILLAGVGLLAGAGVAQAQGIPNGHMPPPGECRVWYPDRPAGRQPPPTDCWNAERQADRYGGRVIYGGREGHGDDRWERDRDRYDERWERDRHRDDNHWERSDREYRDDRWQGRERDDRWDRRKDYRSDDHFGRDRLLQDWARRNFDRDNDGRLSAREARAATIRFEMYADTNEDGHVSATEYRRARAEVTRR